MSHLGLIWPYLPNPWLPQNKQRAPPIKTWINQLIYVTFCVSATSSLDDVTDTGLPTNQKSEAVLWRHDLHGWRLRHEFVWPPCLVTSSALSSPVQHCSGPQDVRFGREVSQIGLKSDKFGTFSYPISVHFDSASQLGPLWGLNLPSMCRFVCWVRVRICV